MNPSVKFPLFIALLLLCVQPLSAQWDSIQLPSRPFVTKLQVNQGIAYACSNAGNVYKSTDQGRNWQLAFHAPNFVINPHNGRFYRYTSDFYYIEVSTNQGQNWTWFANNPYLNLGNVPTLTFSNDDVYAYYAQNLHRLSAPAQPVIPAPAGYSYDQCYIKGQHIWVSAYQSLFHSADGGSHWDTVFISHSLDYQSVSMAVTGDTILVSYFDDTDSVRTLARTSNQGLSWQYDKTHPFIGNIRGSRPFQGSDPNSGKNYYSWNGLTDWQTIDMVPYPYTLASVGATILAGLQSGVFYQQNGQWKLASFAGTATPNELAYSQVYLRKVPGYLLFGSEITGFGMAARADGANAWTMNAEPYFAERPVQIGNHLIGSGAYGTYRAELGQPTFKWELINPQGGFLIAMSGLLYLCDPADNAIYRSSDEGQNWVKTGALPEIEASSSGFKNVLGGTDGRLFLRVYTKLFVSEDEGLTWTLRNTFPTFSGGDVSRLFAVNGYVLISYVLDQQIFFSSDYGNSFSLLPAPKSQEQGVYRLRVVENTLLLFIGDGKLYRSTDWGQNWTSIKPPYPGFNYDGAIANSSSTVSGNKMYLFDSALGVAWTADPDALTYTPCDKITIFMQDRQCSPYISIGVYGAEGNLGYSWYKDGALIQQQNSYYPEFMGQEGSVYTLIIKDLDGGCVLSDSVRLVPYPVADIRDKSPFICSQPLDTLDFSGSSAYEGIRYSLSIYDGPLVYSNYVNANGVVLNPNPPVVAPGHYLFGVYDEIAGCSAVDTIIVKHNPDFTIASIATNNASCGQSDGKATVQNTAPNGAVYSWSTGGSGPTASSLAPGWHSVTVTNAYCAEHRNFLIREDSVCSVKIRGRVYNDTADPDCLPGGAAPAPGVMLHLLPDDVYTYTNEQGYYEFSRPAGNYTVKLAEPFPTELLCPASGSYQLSLPILGDFSNGNDFYFKTKPLRDIGVSVSAGPAIPGTRQTFAYTLWNHGSYEQADVSLKFVHGEGLTNIDPYYTFPLYDSTTQTGISGYYYLPAGYSATFYFSMDVPADLPVGKLLHYSMDILPVSDDFFPENNHVEWSQTVAGSLVGNGKTVGPGETEYGGKIFEKDSLLHYTLRFQNNGNYQATTVEIRDTLDENLDVTSVQVENSDNSYFLKTRFEGHNVLIFTFENINLDFSAANDAGSRGYVAFSVKRKPGLPFGTRIRNRAAVRFDYNKPVMTNIVESVLSEPVGVEPDQIDDADIFIYPNPNTGVFRLELPQAAEPNTALRIVDLAGKMVLEQNLASGSMNHVVDASILSAGLYFLQMRLNDRTLVQKKFVKL